MVVTSGQSVHFRLFEGGESVQIGPKSLPPKPILYTFGLPRIVQIVEIVEIGQGLPDLNDLNDLNAFKSLRSGKVPDLNAFRSGTLPDLNDLNAFKSLRSFRSGSPCPISTISTI